MKSIEKYIEGFLWDSRLVVMTGVIASVFGAFGLFYIATVDAFYTIIHILGYASPDLDMAARTALRSATITHVVEIVDGYLLATFLLIFGLGLYELFISKIDQAEQSENASRVLLISSLDDLKARLAKVVLMILIVRYFEYALEMKFGDAFELLMFAGGITLLGLALYLASLADKNH